MLYMYIHNFFHKCLIQLEVIETTDGMWKKFMEKCCMLVIEFKNMTLAERWFHHCPEVKQHEYLGGDADVILVPLQKPTPPGR